MGNPSRTQQWQQDLSGIKLDAEGKVDWWEVFLVALRKEDLGTTEFSNCLRAVLGKELISEGKSKGDREKIKARFANDPAYLEEPEQPRPEVSVLIREVLQTSSTPVFHEVLLKTLARRHSSIQQALREMVSSGEVVKLETGCAQNHRGFTCYTLAGKS